jgi:hypothetical protein
MSRRIYLTERRAISDSIHNGSVVTRSSFVFMLQPLFQEAKESDRERAEHGGIEFRRISQRGIDGFIGVADRIDVTSCQPKINLFPFILAPTELLST